MGVGEEPVCRATPGRGAGPWGPCQTGADHPPPGSLRGPAPLSCLSSQQGPCRGPEDPGPQAVRV